MSNSHSISVGIGSSAPRSVFGFAPPAPTPQPNADDIEAIYSNTSLGPVKAVIGSEHQFVTTKKVSVPLRAKNADGTPKMYTREVHERSMRVVRSIAPYRSEPVRWVALGTVIEAETEQELLEKIHIDFGSLEHMKKNGIRVVYCAESLTEVSIPVVRNRFDKKTGEHIVESLNITEAALLSDREPG